MRKFLLLSLLFISTPCVAQIEATQIVTSGVFDTDTGLTQTRSVTWTSGRLGVIVASGYLNPSTPDPTVTGVSGTSSGTWTLAINNTTNNDRNQYMYYKENITGGADTVTVTWDQAITAGNIVAVEFSGVAKTSPLGVTAQTTGGGSTAVPTITLNEPTPGSLYVGSWMGIGATGAQAPNYPVTFLVEKESFLDGGVAYRTGSGSMAVSWTVATAGFWSTIGAAFKPEESAIYNANLYGATIYAT